MFENSKKNNQYSILKKYITNFSTYIIIMRIKFLGFDLRSGVESIMGEERNKPKDLEKYG